MGIITEHGVVVGSRGSKEPGFKLHTPTMVAEGGYR